MYLRDVSIASFRMSSGISEGHLTLAPHIIFHSDTCSAIRGRERFCFNSFNFIFDSFEAGMDSTVDTCFYHPFAHRGTATTVSDAPTRDMSSAVKRIVARTSAALSAGIADSISELNAAVFASMADFFRHGCTDPLTAPEQEPDLCCAVMYSGAPGDGGRSLCRPHRRPLLHHGPQSCCGDQD